MKNHYLKAALLLFAGTTAASAQTIKHAKLVISKNQKYVVGPENVLLVDTLVMEDKATIQFSPESAGILKANYAIVGKKCTIISKGANGINSDSKALGTPGQNGGDLSISLHFDQLKSLTIDTRGGRGGNGGRIIDTDNAIFTVKEVKLSDGRTAKEIVATPVGFGIPLTGYKGTDATTGFNGGDGGDINFTYSSKNFIPLFNKSKGKHKIKLLHAAGLLGKNGVTSVDGKLVQVNSAEPKDGEIKLTNNTGASGQK